MIKIPVKMGEFLTVYTPDQNDLNDGVMEAAMDLLTAWSLAEAPVPTEIEDEFISFVSAVDLALGIQPEEQEEE